MFPFNINFLPKSSSTFLLTNKKNCGYTKEANKIYIEKCFFSKFIEGISQYGQYSKNF